LTDAATRQRPRAGRARLKDRLPDNSRWGDDRLWGALKNIATRLRRFKERSQSLVNLRLRNAGLLSSRAVTLRREDLGQVFEISTLNDELTLRCASNGRRKKEHLPKPKSRG
jgi:hypothetical protein